MKGEKCRQWVRRKLAEKNLTLEELAAEMVENPWSYSECLRQACWGMLEERRQVALAVVLARTAVGVGKRIGGRRRREMISPCGLPPCTFGGRRVTYDSPAG